MSSYNVVEDDTRGIFAELLKAKWGQVSYLEVQPVNVRGGHYHKRKNEIFILLDGNCKLLLKNGDNTTIEIEMKRFKRYVVPIETMHTLVNESDEVAKIQVYCNEC